MKVGNVMTKCNHKATGYRGDYPYVYMKSNRTDGIGRIHADLHATCDKCGQDFILCRVHVDRIIRQLLEHPITKQEMLQVIKNFEPQ